MRRIDAACPNCGWTEGPYATDGEAMKAATQHNQTCREQRPKPQPPLKPVREPFVYIH